MEVRYSGEVEVEVNKIEIEKRICNDVVTWPSHLT